MSSKGGFRPNAGRPKYKRTLTPPGDRQPPQLATENRLPIEYMLAVMNDPSADVSRRDRMAIAAAPFCHRREADHRQTKKDQRSEASRSVGGAGSDWASDLEFDGAAN